MITNAAMKNGFTGGVIIDYPNSKKAKKYFLFLMAGFSEEIYNEAKSVIMPTAKTDDNDSDSDDGHKKKEAQIGMYGTNKKVQNQFTKNIKKQKKYHSENGMYKSKSWILAKKDR